MTADYRQQALLAIETLRARVRELESASQEPIAVVGYAGRFPGAPDAEAYWSLLREGREGISEIPADRWDVDAFYDDDPDVPGKMRVRRAGFIENITDFDAPFFGISPREATYMDPQHRLLLETTWQALEHAGIAASDLAGSRTGVFMGLSTQDYLGLVTKNMSYEDIEAYLGTGTSPAAAIGRISYRLGLEGPAVTVDTACSSSLVAIHQACQALRSGECEMTLAGGVNALISPGTMINFSKANMLSPDGRCKTFDAAADGYVRGEGCGVIVMKRLSDALRDGDHIRAVIRGSAVNQDGASGGLTVPNGRAQQRVIADALKSAGLEPRDIDYLEAHGTGTSLGDPIEVQAAAAALGVDRDKPLLIASAKTNIGHLEAAAGIAGIIKVIMSLENRLLPKHLNFQNPSPHIPWEKIPVEVLREARTWDADGKTRIAGISSFGFSGTNAHVIVEEAPAQEASADVTPPAADSYLLPLSGQTAEALQDLASNYLSWLDANPAVHLADVAHTAASGRSHMPHRAAVVAESTENAKALLQSIVEEKPASGAFTGVSSDPPKTAWLFTGQGSQYAGMARELYDSQPVFREVLDHCEAVLRDEIESPLLAVIFGDAPGVSHTSYAQPALFAIEMALARLWQHWGLEPDVVLGHSVGQYAAACVAGVFSLEDGLKLLAKRGKLMGALPEGGSMAAVFSDAVTVEERLDDYPRLSVAAYNGAHTVVSGPSEDVKSLMESFQARGVRCEPLDTSHAFHSSLLDPMLDEFERYASEVEFKPLQRALVCNRTGKLLNSQSQMDAPYWRRHARQPVQFAESVQTLSDLGCRVLLEIGPQPVLTAMAMRAWPEGPVTPKAVASMRKGQPDGKQLKEALAQLYVAGARANFHALDSHVSHQKVDLPTYPFQRKRFWPKLSHLQMDEFQGKGILGSRRDLASGDVVFSSRWSLEHQPWLADHTIYGTVIVPGTTYATMALLATDLPVELQEVYIFEPIIIGEKESREVQLTLQTPEDGVEGLRSFQIHSRASDDREAQWSLNASGTLRPARADALGPEPEDSVETIIGRMTPKRVQELFDGFEENDLKWGPTWRTSLNAVWDGEGESLGEIRIGEELGTYLTGEALHPVILDLCTGIAAVGEPDSDEENRLSLPLKYDLLTLREPAPRRFYCRATWQHDRHAAQTDTQSFDLDFLTPEGRRFGGIRNFTVKRAPRQALLRGLGADSGRLLYRVSWRELPLEAPAADDIKPGTWFHIGTGEDVPQNAPSLLQRTLTLHLGDDWQVVDDDNLTIDPSRPEHWEDAIKLVADRGEALAGIVWRIPPASAGQARSLELELDRLKSGFSSLLPALQNLVRSPLPRGIWIITERAVATEPGEDVDPVQAAFWGFGRTVAAEEPGLRCVLVDTDGTADAQKTLADLLLTGGSENQLALRQRKCFVPRVLPWMRSGQMAVPSSEDYLLQPVERGTIDHLDLVPLELEEPPAGYVQVRVQAAGLNFRDVLNVLDLYPGDPGPVGGELAGVVTAVGEGVSDIEVGQRVFGFGPGAFASRVNVPAPFVARIPDRLTAVEATTTPATMLTAGLAFSWAKPQKGERVLIHAATGGVGMAAVQYVQNCGAIVYATASRPKQKLLREMGVEHIYDSRSTAFGDQILADTDGKGVDVVLNSLTSEGFVEATVKATARNGRFVEIAKINTWTPEQMTEARPDISYEILAVDEIMANDPLRIKALMLELAGRLESGELKPLSARVYPITEAKLAFRFMQQARHVGKIVLQMPSPLRPREDRTYLVTGGLGALGLRTAAHLAQLGAQHVVLVSRREPDEETQSFIDEISEQYRSQVHVFPADISEEGQVARLLDRIDRELPPLGGVAHLAGVVEDALLGQQSWEGFRTVLGPKALGALHLDRLTRSAELDFFFLYSSASSVLGSPGQANYAAANGLLDGLAAHRQAQGLAATTLNWGPWAEAGMAATEKARANLSKQGLVALRPPAALSALNQVVAHGTTQAIVINANWQRAARLYGPMRPPILEQLLPRDASGIAVDSALLRHLNQVPAAQRADFLTEHLQSELQQILALAAPPAPDSRFLELGMDSLMAVELRNRLLAQFGSAFTISSTVVFDYPTIRGLAEYLASATPDVIEEASSAAAEVEVTPPLTLEDLEQKVTDLAAKLESFSSLGLKLQLDGAEIETREELTQAILKQEAAEASSAVLADALLPEDVKPSWEGKAPAVRTHVLLTGATGYLGGFVLRDLLRAKTPVTALVRCQNEAEGTNRVIANLKGMQIWEPEFADSFTVLRGDISQPQLGLAPEAFASLSEEIDSVIHCAGLERQWEPYATARRANASGVLHALQFVSAGTPKVLHMPVPAAAFSGMLAREMPVSEGEFPESPQDVHTGYGQSKWAAESLARQAQERGVPVVIYRASGLLGASDGIFWSPRALSTQLLSRSLESGMADEASRIFDGVPVDVLARFINETSAHPSAESATYHVFPAKAPEALEWTEIVSQGGTAIRAVTRDEWKAAAVTDERSPVHALFEYRGTGTSMVLIDCLLQQPAFDSPGFQARLAASGIAMPDYAGLIARGWLKGLQPQEE